jgi:hypothetical protein
MASMILCFVSDFLNHLVSIRFSDSLSRKGVIEATLADDRTPTFSPGSALQIGIQVTLPCDHTAMAAGTIVAVASHFGTDAGPTIGFTATMRRATDRPASGLQLTWGTELLSFDVVEQALRPARRPVIASGVAQGVPALRAGAALTVKGLGTRWSGDYAVSETTHTFDREHGYRVKFACAR